MNRRSILLTLSMGIIIGISGTALAADSIRLEADKYFRSFCGGSERPGAYRAFLCEMRQRLDSLEGRVTGIPRPVIVTDSNGNKLGHYLQDHGEEYRIFIPVLEKFVAINFRSGLIGQFTPKTAIHFDQANCQGNAYLTKDRLVDPNALINAVNIELPPQLFKVDSLVPTQVMAQSEFYGDACTNTASLANVYPVSRANLPFTLPVPGPLILK